jgi:hypothetical protein
MSKCLNKNGMVNSFQRCILLETIGTEIEPAAPYGANLNVYTVNLNNRLSISAYAVVKAESNIIRIFMYEFITKVHIY